MNEIDIEKQLSEITLPEVHMDEHKTVTKKRMTQLRNTPFIGVLIITLVAIGSGNFAYFIDLPSLLFVLLIPLFLLVGSYGVGGVKMILTAPFQMNAIGEKREAYITVLKDFRTYTVISGWFGVALGAVLMFNSSGLWERDLDKLLPVFGILIMTLFYGYFFGYFYAYPLQKRFEHNC